MAARNPFSAFWPFAQELLWASSRRWHGFYFLKRCAVLFSMNFASACQLEKHLHKRNWICPIQVSASFQCCHAPLFWWMHTFSYVFLFDSICWKSSLSFSVCDFACLASESSGRTWAQSCAFIGVRWTFSEVVWEVWLSTNAFCVI